MTLQERLRSRRPEILSAAERYGAHDVRVFGSVVRGTEVFDSDVDFLVTLDPGRTLLDAGGLQVELEELLGCRVDLILDGNLTGRTGERIARTARPLAPPSNAGAPGDPAPANVQPSPSPGVSDADCDRLEHALSRA